MADKHDMSTVPHWIALLPDAERTSRPSGGDSTLTLVGTWDTTHSHTDCLGAAMSVALHMWDGVYTVGLHSYHTMTWDRSPGRLAVCQAIVAMGCGPGTSPHWIVFWDDGQIEIK